MKQHQNMASVSNLVLYCLKTTAAAFYRDEFIITWGLLKAAKLQVDPRKVSP